MDETLSEIATGETPFDLDVEEDPLEPAMDDPLDLDIDEAILDAAMEDAIEPAMEDAVEPAIEEPIEQPTEDDPPVEPPAEDPPVEAPVDDGMSYRNRRGVYKIEKYRSCEVIIIDQIRRDDATNSELLKHYKMNEKVARFFRKYTNYRVRVLRFPEGSRPRDWDQFWKGKLREKREGDLLVLYFHGRARGLGDKWEWLLRAHPRGAVNAYNLVHKINRTHADCLLILDCWMPTRALKWKRKVATHGNTEIFSKGETVPNARGNVPAIDGTFSKALIKSSREYFDLVRQGVFKAPMSILEVMKTAAVACNPRRVWLNAPRHPYKEKITRIKLLPWKIRESGKLEFFRYHVQELEERFCEYRKLSKEPTPAAGGDGEQVEDEEIDDGGVEADDEGVVADVMEEGEEEREKLEAGSQGDDNKNADHDGDGNASDNDGGGLFVSQRGVSQRGVSQGGEPLTPKSPSPEF